MGCGVIKRLIKSLFTIKNNITIGELELSKWTPIKMAESSFDEILITNDKGWFRVCTCIRKNNSLAFYDRNDVEIKGFKPTMFLKLSKPIIDRDYIIAMAKHFNLTVEDLR